MLDFLNIHLTPLIGLNWVKRGGVPNSIVEFREGPFEAASDRRDFLLLSTDEDERIQLWKYLPKKLSKAPHKGNKGKVHRAFREGIALQQRLNREASEGVAAPRVLLGWSWRDAAPYAQITFRDP